MGSFSGGVLDESSPLKRFRWGEGKFGDVKVVRGGVGGSGRDIGIVSMKLFV